MLIYSKSRGFKEIKYNIFSNTFHQQFPTRNYAPTHSLIIWVWHSCSLSSYRFEMHCRLFQKNIWFWFNRISWKPALSCHHSCSKSCQNSSWYHQNLSKESYFRATKTAAAVAQNSATSAKIKYVVGGNLQIWALVKRHIDCVSTFSRWCFKARDLFQLL